MANMVTIPPSVWEPDYQYFYMENRDGTNRISQSHQDLIKQNYKSIFNEYNNFTNKGDYISWIKSQMEKRKKMCLEEEYNFVKQLKDQHSDFKQAYYDLSNKSGTNAINLFTDYFSLGRLKGKTTTPNLAIDRQKMDFKIAVSSKEFTELMKSRGPEGGYHFFSREKFAEAMGISITKNKNGKGISKQSETAIKKELFNQIDEDINKSKFWNSIYHSFESIKIDGREKELNDLFLMVRENLREQLKNLTNDDDYKTIIRNVLDQTLIMADKEGIVDASKVGGGLNVSLKDSSPNFLRITVAAMPGALEKKYSEISQKGYDKAYELGAEIFVNAAEEVLQSMNPETELDLLWIDIAIDKTTFWTNALTYLKSHKEELIKLVSDIMGRQDSSWKEKMNKELNEIINNGKKPYDFISGVTGIVGEFSSALGYSSFSDIMVDANGAAHDKMRLQKKNNEIDMKNFGQSFKDLVLNSRYGVNIKYYLSATDSITLYEEKSGSKGYRIIGTDVLFKYIDTKTLMMMRFLEANYKYLTEKLGFSMDKDSLDKLYLNVSIANLANFLRQDTTIPNMGMNIFFQINNAIIPSSAIYEIIIKAIENNSDVFNYGKKNKSNLWFEINRNGVISYDTYDSINQNIVNEHFISELKNEQYKGAVIHFKGLKIEKAVLAALM